MSWMDSWSRPKKSQATPPPLYLTHGGENTPYCHSCGRVVANPKPRKTSRLLPNIVRFDRCKSRKVGKVDRRIEATFVALLNGADASTLAAHPANLAADAPIPATKPGTNQKKKIVKGDPRITVMCEEVETIIFGSRFDPEKTHGRKRNRAKRTLGDESEEDNYTDNSQNRAESNRSGVTNPASTSPENSSDGDDGEASDTSVGGVPLPDKSNDTRTTSNNSRTDTHDDVLSDHKNFGAGKVRPAQLDAEVNFSVGGERGWAEKLEETPEMLEKRREGQRKADERESIRCAARRLCAFGYAIEVEAGDVMDESDDGGKKQRGRKKKSARAAAAEEDDQGRQGSGDLKEKTKTKMKKCEAVMNAAVVESSFAKGEWGIRWREDQ